MTVSFTPKAEAALTVCLVTEEATVGGNCLKPGDLKLHLGAQPPAATLRAEQDADRYALMKLFAKAVALCRREELASLAFDLSAIESNRALLENCVYSSGYACHLADYSFDHYKTKKAENHVDTVHLTGFSPCERLEALLLEGATIGKRVCVARDLVNMRSHQMTPMALAEEAKKLDGKNGISVKVLDRAAMEELKMGGLLSVSQAAHHAPAFIIMRYQGDPGSDRIHGVVGKGLTYDSGGLSLKSTSGMVEMHTDMGGAAATIGAMGAIGAMGLKANVTAVVPACENMPTNFGYRPGDIITMMNGKTVSVRSTDAEGRLVMADALTWLHEKEKTATLIDVATLTGAAAQVAGPLVVPVAIGGGYCPDILKVASNAAGNITWPMPNPLPEDYVKFIKDDHADLANTAGGSVSMIGAALFLREFTGGLPWLHLDIAGASRSEKGSELDPAGGNGIGTALIYHLIAQNQAR